MSDKPCCPWCGRNMDELENGNIDGHTWYRDDSFYIKDLERTRRFLEERVAGLTERGTQLEQLCRDLYRVLMCELICAEVPLEGNGTYQDMKQRMDTLGLLEGGE